MYKDVGKDAGTRQVVKHESIQRKYIGLYRTFIEGTNERKKEGGTETYNKSITEQKNEGEAKKYKDKRKKEFIELVAEHELIRY